MFYNLGLLERSAPITAERTVEEPPIRKPTKPIKRNDTLYVLGLSTVRHSMNTIEVPVVLKRSMLLILNLSIRNPINMPPTAHDAVYVMDSADYRLLSNRYYSSAMVGIHSKKL